MHGRKVFGKVAKNSIGRLKRFLCVSWIDSGTSDIFLTREGFGRFWHFFEKFSVLAGGRCPPDTPVFGWGGKASPDPPLNRSFVTFDQGGQTGPPRSNDFFFGAADDTGADDDHLSGRPAGRSAAGRPAERPRPHDQTNTRPRGHAAT